MSEPPQPEPVPVRARWAPWTALLVCLGSFAFLSWRTALSNGPTFDEPPHLADGWLSLKSGDYSVNPEHPPLAKQWAALPLLFRSDMPSGEIARSLQNLGPWDIARSLFFSSGVEYADTVLRTARRQALLFGAGLILAIYAWASRLWGPWGGVFSAALAGFCPTVIAHACLVHTDIPATMGFVLVACLSWRCLRAGVGWRHVLALGAALGFTLAVKFSGILAVLPVVAMLAASPTRQAVGASELHSTNRPWLQRLERIAVVLGIAWAATVLEYGWPPRLDAYWLGMRMVYQRVVENYEFFFFGELSTERFPLYFLGAMSVKTPLPALAAWIFAAVCLIRGGLRNGGYPLAWAFYLLCAVSALAANIGVRYALPVYAMLFVFAGALVRPGLGWRRIRGLAALAIVACSAFVGLRSVPFGIAYFNPIGGPPEKAVRRLDDSNLDWGQAIPQTVEYIHSHPGERISLNWFSRITPFDYGVRCPRLLDHPDQILMPDEATYIVTPQMLSSRTIYEGIPGLTCEWLDEYRPAQILGCSIWVYRFGYSEDEGAKFDKKTGIQWIYPVPMFQRGVKRLRELAAADHKPELLKFAALGSVRLAVWLRDHRRFEEARRAFLEARADGGDELSIAAGLALVNGDLGDFDNAQSEIDFLRRRTPGNPSIDEIQRQVDGMRKGKSGR